MLSEELNVDSVNMLKVELPVGAGGNFISVDIVIVKAHKYRTFAVDAQLCCQAVCRRGFT